MVLFIFYLRVGLAEGLLVGMDGHGFDVDGVVDVVGVAGESGGWVECVVSVIILHSEIG